MKLGAGSKNRGWELLEAGGWKQEYEMGAGLAFEASCGGGEFEGERGVNGECVGDGVGSVAVRVARMDSCNALANPLYPKLKPNYTETQARSGKILALTNPGTDLTADDRWEFQNAEISLSSFFVFPAVQLFVYEMATYLGTDVNQPRSLAKSVTVE